MANDLAVPYVIYKKGSEELYSYCDKKYPTKNLMLEEILKRHSTVNSSNIVLLNIGTYHTPENFQKAPQHIYENPFPQSAKKRPSQIVIQEFCHHGKMYYSCLEKTFPDYGKAKAYTCIMNLKVRFTFKNMDHPKVPKELNVLKKVKYFGFSNRIWRGVWKNCYFYRCFAANDFFEFKLRLLSEMNYYRMRHNAKPVTVNKLATKLAEAYLQRILNTGVRFTEKRLLQNYESLPYYFAPLFFKKWYDESKHYKYGTKVAITGTEHFTSMVCKIVKYIGIAVKEVNNIIHIFVVYEPLPNDVKLFSSHVGKRKYKLYG